MSRPARFERAREIGAFAGVGSIAFAIQLLLFTALTRTGIGALTSNAIALLAATLVAYLGNRHVSFADRISSRVGPEAAAFLAVNAITFAIAELVLAAAYLAHAQHDEPVLITLNITGTAIGTVLRYLGYRRFVFVGPRPQPDMRSARLTDQAAGSSAAPPDQRRYPRTGRRASALTSGDRRGP